MGVDYSCSFVLGCSPAMATVRLYRTILGDPVLESRYCTVFHRRGWLEDSVVLREGGGGRIASPDISATRIANSAFTAGRARHLLPAAAANSPARGHPDWNRGRIGCPRSKSRSRARRRKRAVWRSCRPVPEPQFQRCVCQFGGLPARGHVRGLRLKGYRRAITRKVAGTTRRC